jgi:purine catabolism regulator
VVLTVQRLLVDRRLGLTLVAGAAGADRPITWAHAIELDDPTPWLGGGELVMTTGLGLSSDAEEQRAYVRRLHARGVTALALDTGPRHPVVPEPLSAEAEALGLPLLAVDARVPFIAIGRAVAEALASDEVAAAKRVVDQQQRHARAALEGGIRALVEELASTLEADVLVLDPREHVLASAGRHVVRRQQALLARSRRRRRSGVHVDDTGHLTSQALGVVAVPRGQILVATPGPLSSTQRLLVSHAASLISLELEKPAEVLTVERRLRGRLLQALLSGVLDGDLNQLRSFGFLPEQDVVVLVLLETGPVLAAEHVLEEAVAAAGLPYLSAAEEDRLTVLLAAPFPEGLPEQLQSALRQELRRSVSAGLGSRSALGRAAVSRRQAEAAARVSRSGGRGLLRFDELGTYDLLLGGQSEEALSAVAAAALRPLDEYDADRGGDLVATLEAFLAHNGQWEATAASLGVHRHTVRNRLDKATELLGRDLESAHVRAELWLAVKARELVRLRR